LVAIAFATVGLALSAPATDQPTPSLPYEDWGACPFECCTYRDWSVRQDTELLAERRDDAPIVVRVRPGDRVIGITGVVVTTQLGLAEVVGRTTESGKERTPGERWPVLNYVGEGYWRVWDNGYVFDEFVSDERACRSEAARGRTMCSVLLRSRPVTTWWVRVRGPLGQEGWTRHVDRFGNIDACG
jgi:hypothetical protein